MFIDRVINTKQYLVKGDPIIDRNDLVQSLIDATALLVDNVAEYYYQTCKKDELDLVRDFPNIAPPWPLIWCEWSPKQFINSDKYGIISNAEYGVISKYGVLLRIISISKTEYDTNDYGEMTTIREYLRRQLRLTPYYNLRLWEHNKNISPICDKNPEIGWYVQVIGFMEANNNIQILPIMFGFYITKAGEFMTKSPNSYENFSAAPIVKNITDEEASLYPAKILGRQLSVALLSLCFANCRNVKMTENKPANRLQRIRKGKGRLPFLSNIISSK